MYEQFKTKIGKLSEALLNGKQGPNDQERYIIELLRQGRKAADLQEFMTEFSKMEQQRMLERMATEEDAVTIQKDYQAFLRFTHYLQDIIHVATTKTNELHRRKSTYGTEF